VTDGELCTALRLRKRALSLKGPSRNGRISDILILLVPDGATIRPTPEVPLWCSPYLVALTLSVGVDEGR